MLSATCRGPTYVAGGEGPRKTSTLDLPCQRLRPRKYHFLSKTLTKTRVMLRMRGIIMGKNNVMQNSLSIYGTTC